MARHTTNLVPTPLPRAAERCPEPCEPDGEGSAGSLSEYRTQLELNSGKNTAANIERYLSWDVSWISMIDNYAREKPNPTVVT